MRGRNKTSQVVRYTVDRRPPHGIDPESRLLIIEWPSNGHDGGDLAFGNDGFLYVSSGDGSSDSDADLTGQSLDDLLAAVLRIDVDHPDPGRNYGVPKDNPFVDRPGARPELWAYGLRNPWRLSYDRESGQLWVGQNGQDLWEQVYLIQKGANYGWSLTEGSHMFNAQRQAGPDRISPPAAEHHHSEARSLTGGRVYRGTRLPGLVGTYVYGDWSTGHVWGIKHDGTRATWQGELVDTPFNITGFGTDHAGELYVIDQLSGFHRFEPTTEADRPSRPFPTTLSASGLFASLAEHKPHPAALAYDVCAPQWADGAAMERFALLTGLERIEQKPQLNAGGWWTLPDGSVLVQTLSLDLADAAGKPDRKRIETRLLVRQQGEWTGYSYRWNAAANRRRSRPGRRHCRGAGGRRPDRAGRPARADLAVPRPHRVHGLPLAGVRVPPGLQPTPARPRPRLWRHHRQPAPHPRAHRRLPGPAPPQARRPAATGQPLRGAGSARGPGQVLPPRQLLDLPRQGGGWQRTPRAGPHHPGRQDAPDR